MGKIPKSRLKRQEQMPGLRWVLAFVIISLFAITVGSRSFATPYILGMRAGASTVAKPLTLAGNLLFKPLSSVSTIAHNLGASQTTLTELENQNAQLSSQLAALEEYKLENTRLNKLLDIKNAYNLKSTAARVIGSQLDAWERIIVIDKGSNSGIGLNMAVMDAFGLMGQVIEVGPTSAKVRLINDEHSGVSAIIQSTRVPGVVVGNVDGSLTLNYIPTTEQVNEGDMVVTSGMGGIFPKGIVIGRVKSVQKDSAALYANITVEPISKHFNPEEVLIITDKGASEADVSGIELPSGESGTTQSNAAASNGSAATGN